MSALRNLIVRRQISSSVYEFDWSIAQSGYQVKARKASATEIKFQKNVSNS